MEIKFGKAKAKYLANGITTSFQVPFPYLKQNDIFTTVTLTDGSSWTGTTGIVWPNANTIQFVNGSTVVPPPNGAIIWIERFSSLLGDSRRVDFTDGSTITEEQLDLAYQQTLFVAEEALDEAGSIFLVAEDLEGALADATGLVAQAQAFRDAAGVSALNASTSETNAAGSASAAAASAAAAAASAVSAAFAVGTFALLKSNNLSDLTDPAQARINLGVTPFDATAPGPIGSVTPSTGAFTNLTATTALWVKPAATTYFAVNQGNYVALQQAVPFGWTAGDATAGLDTILRRDGAAGVIAQRNGTNTQTFHLYETYTDSVNYRRIRFQAAAGTATILAEAAGTGGSSQSMVLQAQNLIQFNSGGSTGRWQINSSGHLLGVTDNTYDIGASGATRPRSIYAGTTINLPTGGAYLWGANSAIHVASDEVYNFRRGTAGSIRFQVNAAADVAVQSGAAYAWSSTSDASGTRDLLMFRDAAGQLALRNGANAQQFGIYQTYTDASNFNKLSFEYTGSDWWIKTVKVGSGADRSIFIGPTGATNELGFVTASSIRWKLSSAGHLFAQTDNTYDIGATAANRPRNVFVAGNLTVGGTISGTVSITQEAITAPTLTNSWTNFGSGWRAAGYWKDASGNVHLTGNVTGGSLAGPIFTLPSGYRPTSGHELFAVTSNGGFGQISISTAGAVTLEVGSAAGITNLCGIVFRPS